MKVRTICILFLAGLSSLSAQPLDRCKEYMMQARQPGLRYLLEANDDGILLPGEMVSARLRILNESFKALVIPKIESQSSLGLDIKIPVYYENLKQSIYESMGHGMQVAQEIYSGCKFVSETLLPGESKVIQIGPREVDPWSDLPNSVGKDVHRTKGKIMLWTFVAGSEVAKEVDVEPAQLVAVQCVTSLEARANPSAESYCRPALILKTKDRYYLVFALVSLNAQRLGSLSSKIGTADYVLELASGFVRVAASTGVGDVPKFVSNDSRKALFQDEVEIDINGYRSRLSRLWRDSETLANQRKVVPKR